MISTNYVYGYLVEIPCMQRAQRAEQVELGRVVAPVREVDAPDKGHQTLRPLLRIGVADDRLLVVGVEGPHKLAAQPQPAFFGTRHVGADHVRPVEIAEGLLVVRAHEALQHAGVVGLLVPGHDEDADTLGGFAFEQLAQVRVRAPAGRLPTHQADVIKQNLLF